MERMNLSCLCAATLTTSLVTVNIAMAQVQANSVPVNAFATLPRISHVHMSFDGRSVAWVDQGSSPAQIIAFDLTTGKDRKAFALPPKMTLSNLAWADNDTLLYTTNMSVQVLRDNRIKYEYTRIFSADLITGKTQMLLSDQPDFEFITGAYVLATHTTKPKTAILYTLHRTPTAGGRHATGSHIAVGAKDSSWVTTIYAVDTGSGHSNRIDEGSAITAQWLVDPDGNSVARSEWDRVWAERKSDYTILAKHGASWSTIYHRNDGNTLSTAGLTTDRKSIIAVGMDTDGRSKLLAIPLDGSERQVLFEDPNLGVASVILDDFDRHPTGVFLDGPDVQLHYIDPLLQSRAKALSSTFPGTTVQLLSHSLDNVKQLVETFSANKPATYYVIDFNTHKADILGDAYPALSNVKLGNVSAITYTARDGQSIPAYLTSPNEAATDKPLPLVVLVHDGPASRDHLEFNVMTQLLASRGYRVLQPQFRGSIGFGEDFRKAGMRQWGGLMQDDITDGVKSLIQRQLADAKHVCIVGSGYGGYAAMAGVAFTPELYRCAISIDGMFDLPMMDRYEEKRSGELSTTVAYWRENVGSAQDQQLAEKSPNRHAARVSAPVLILQSSDDARVPAEQTETMVNALQQMGKPVKLVKIAGDGDWSSSNESSQQTLSEIDAFLRANLLD